MKFKIAVFMGTCAVSAATGIIIFLAPLFEKLHSLQNQRILLNNRWQQQQLAANHRQQLQRDIVSLKNSYLQRLKILNQSRSPANIYAQIAVLAKTHGLHIITLKPQKNQIIAHLNQQIFSLDIQGEELHLLYFLLLLMHSPELLEIHKLEFTHINADIHLQATLAIYYAAE